MNLASFSFFILESSVIERLGALFLLDIKVYLSPTQLVILWVSWFHIWIYPVYDLLLQKYQEHLLRYGISHQADLLLYLL